MLLRKNTNYTLCNIVGLYVKVMSQCVYMLHPVLNYRERYEAAIKDLEKKQETTREKLTRMQQEYRQAAIKAGLVH